jgi:alginate O-acetyltransferase complex protein AlgJ
MAKPINRARGSVALTLIGCGVLACHASGAKYPWGDAAQAPAEEHAEVHTLNDGYQRERSQVWVREVAKPTRANLDYAAYHANFMIADPEPETPVTAQKPPDTSHPFAGLLETSSLTSDVAKTALSPAERHQPLAFAPLSEFLQARKVAGAEALAEVGSAVRSEKWGLALPPGTTGQALSEVYLHQAASGEVELWAKVEFAPWFKPFADSPDQDHDGYPELYGRVAKSAFTPALASAIRQDYLEPVLGAAEIKAWANQLSSYWYPSFNTDLIPAGKTWPDEQTEANIKQELASKSFTAPSIVLRGKPQGKPTYNVFLIHDETEAKPNAAPDKPALQLAKTKPSPNPKLTLDAVERELADQGGGSFAKWNASLEPFHQALKKRLKALPPKAKALAGEDGFLFYKNGLEYAAGGDLEKQKKGKNPLPVIVEFKQELDKLGVDFLFVPVPDKLEVYPEKLDADFKPLAGKVVNPAFRKLLQSLAKEGVEVVDLLPAFLQARAAGGTGSEAFLYQHQDTHWTDRGLRLTADLLTARLKRYPWYAELSKQKRAFSERETTFTRFGDLQSRLPEAEQKRYTPETLLAHQVIGSNKQPYDDEPESPIVMLGDSFTGVYELTDAEHAGISAHVARGISYPLDLVMSYGGGPNVRQKLMRRGEAALGTKKLVIWLMTARDLYNYWEDWEPLKKP